MRALPSTHPSPYIFSFHFDQGRWRWRLRGSSWWGPLGVSAPYRLISMSNPIWAGATVWGALLTRRCFFKNWDWSNLKHFLKVSALCMMAGLHDSQQDIHGCLSLYYSTPPSPRPNPAHFVYSLLRQIIKRQDIIFMDIPLARLQLWKLSLFFSLSFFFIWSLYYWWWQAYSKPKVCHWKDSLEEPESMIR